MTSSNVDDMKFEIIDLSMEESAEEAVCYRTTTRQGCSL